MVYQYYGEDLEHGLFGRQKANHKYISRKLVNGKWVYTYDLKKAARVTKKQIKKDVRKAEKSLNKAYDKVRYNVGKTAADLDYATTNLKQKAKPVVAKTKAKTASAYNKVKNTVVSTAKTTSKKVKNKIQSILNPKKDVTPVKTAAEKAKAKYNQYGTPKVSGANTLPKKPRTYSV